MKRPFKEIVAAKRSGKKRSAGARNGSSAVPGAAAAGHGSTPMDSDEFLRRLGPPPPGVAAWRPPYVPSGDPQSAVYARAVDPPPPAAERPRPGSRVRILEVALQLFGARGFADTSVRDLAARAEVNLAAVNYHFRSKENLWLEALRYGFSDTVLPCHKMHAELHIARREGTIEAAETALRNSIHIFLKEVVGPEQKHWAMFVRERLNPGPAMEMVMREYFEPLGNAFGGILLMLLPDHPPEKIKLCLTSIIGQCVHIRMAAPTIQFFSGYDPASPEFLEMTANHIAEFSINAVRGMRGTLAARDS
jgi:AcrR family transcriptional regulator